MKLGIMQPYFLPYIGYWQLLEVVDTFVVYDNIQYTKKGWFNRNRILDGDHDRLFTLPLKKDSDYLNVDERFLSDDSRREIDRTLRVIQATYKKAPQYEVVYPLIEKCFLYDQTNLFEYVRNSITTIAEYLGIGTPIVVSSTIDIDHSLKSQDKVIALCKALGADSYINSSGGQDLYDRSEFAESGIELSFIRADLQKYPQFGQEFVAGLSIVDVMMFNDQTTVRQMLQDYTLL